MMHITHEEIKDIVKAYLGITLAFAILLSNGLAILSAPLAQTAGNLLISAITVGIGFVLHEIGHKVVAQRYGYVARFKSFDPMIGLAVVTAFFGFLFAAPGAVVIQGVVSREKNGRIAAAGPLVNIVLAIVFLIFAYLTQWQLLFYGGLINAFLAFFNLIPFGNFDGLKVLAWNKQVFTSLIGISGILLFLPYLF